MALGIARERIRAFDGLRGLAAIQIVLGHFSHLILALFPQLHPVDGWIRPGSFAVALFFIISGFVITLLALNRDSPLDLSSYARFLGDRLRRLAPTYLAALIGMVGLVIGAMACGVRWNPASYRWDCLIPEIFMIHQWWPTTYLGWNYPAWSISVFVAMLIFIFPYVLLFNQKVSSVLLQGAVAVGVFFAFVQVRPHPDYFGYGHFRVGCPFVLGSLLCAWRMRVTTQPRYLIEIFSWLGAALYVGGHFAMNHANPGALHTAIITAALVMLIWGITWPESSLARTLANPWLCRLGAASYALYLGHGLAQRIGIGFHLDVFAHDATFTTRMGLLLANAGLVVLVTGTLYFCVEKPCANLRQRRRPKVSVPRKKHLPERAISEAVA